jgi:hypothetical protein
VDEIKRPRECMLHLCGRNLVLPPSPSFAYSLHSSRTSARTRCRSSKKIKKIKKSFLFFARWKRGEKNFGFQSPRSPSSPSSLSSASCASEGARRRRFFRPSSPSHPSKLYSSLGWLNSKVPKPFFPFTLRLIDVDGF